MFPIPNLSTIEYNNENDILVFKMKGKMIFEEYKNYFLNILKEAKKYNCRYWIYDLSEYKTDCLHARTWQITVFLPRCFRELNKELIVGVIPPQSATHRINIKTAVMATKKMDYSYQLSYFTDTNKAIEWILTKKR